MIEHIGAASTMQAKTFQSVKAAENAKTQEFSEKESAAVQANEPRKRDRFEYSGEVSYAAGSPDDPKAREAFDEKRSAAQASNPRSYDRVEFSEKYLSAKPTESVNRDMSAEQSGEELGDEISNEEVSSSQSISDDSSESVETNKLYQYTDTELKEFLIDGSITQSEYDAEIAKREF